MSSKDRGSKCPLCSLPLKKSSLNDKDKTLVCPKCAESFQEYQGRVLVAAETGILEQLEAILQEPIPPLKESPSGSVKMPQFGFYSKDNHITALYLENKKQAREDSLYYQKSVYIAEADSLIRSLTEIEQQAVYSQALNFARLVQSKLENSHRNLVDR
ncbi:MAG: hypothetical protein ACFFBD_26830, partial [Candidatus Hodarchaeota archaeon]